MCMFLVLTGMPVTVQAADYDGGTGSAEKTQETYLKTFLEDLDFAELDTWTKEELFPEQREKFSFRVMVQGTAYGWNRSVTSWKKSDSGCVMPCCMR